MEYADLLDKLNTYVRRFNETDEECYPQAICNEDAYTYLSQQIPLFECPDSQIEETYYFRWWTYRKHWKQTPKGHIVTEFLPPVSWAGPYNSINCAAGFHIREGRWLSDPDEWLKEYIRFWLNRDGDVQSYSVWMATAVEEYCTLRGDSAFAEECLASLITLYEDWEIKSLHPSGLFWSIDDRDAMEMSISGSGLRPTLNSYMYGDACAIARMAAKFGRLDIADTFQQKANKLQSLIETLLWDKEFYKVIPCERDGYIDIKTRPQIPKAHDVRELIGFIPWYFNMPKQGRAKAFVQLLDTSGFAADYGMTTAEQRHPRFMYEHEHECLWNGPSWPYSTSQTLVALANALHTDPQIPLTKQHYYALLKQYAATHQRINENGTRVPWIDENIDPFTGDWIARTQLEKRGWDPAAGGYERGKDYNHSMFCDHVLSGLMGIGIDYKGELVANPMIPEDWDYARVSRILHGNRAFTVIYDRTGDYYGKGKGIRIMQDD